MYLIADGCAEDIISVSLLSNAFKSSQATCSNDILQLVNRFYNVAEQWTGNIYYLLFLICQIFFFFRLFSFQLCLVVWNSWKSPKQLALGREYKTLLLSDRSMLDLPDESPGINDNFILKTKQSACILHIW